MSWRPPTSIMVRVDLESGAEDFTYLHSYIRYSCDKAHWSTWYNLSPAKTKTDGMAFTYEGWLSLPQIARKAYSDLAQEWWKTDPAWSSDEHELCVWIAKRKPEFFSSEFPFIFLCAGYSTHKRFVFGGEECASPFAYKTLLSGKTLVAY